MINKTYKHVKTDALTKYFWRHLIVIGCAVLCHGGASAHHHTGWTKIVHCLASGVIVSLRIRALTMKGLCVGLSACLPGVVCTERMIASAV